MARKKLKSQTEWLVHAMNRGSSDAHSVVVYRLKSSVDAATGEPTLQRLWVAARGYAGAGVFEDYSAVMYSDGDGLRIVGCDYASPDSENFDEDDLPYIADKDYEVIASLWRKVEKLAIFDLEQQAPIFTINVDMPKQLDSACSPDWNGDLLIPISDQWPLSLQF
jgi:hypothetical protein